MTVADKQLKRTEESFGQISKQLLICPCQNIVHCHQDNGKIWKMNGLGSA